MKTLKCLTLFFLFFINTSHSQNPLLKQWDYRYGGTDADRLRYFLQTKSGEFLIGGDSYSGIGGDKSQPSWGFGDYWVVKLDASGIKLWDKNYGGTNSENLTCFDETTDGGFIIGGISQSGIGGDKTQPLWGNSNDEDYWIVKIDSLGNKEWDKDLGGTHYDELLSIKQTTDGGYILGGSSASDSTGDKTQPQWGYFDYWVIKLDSNGNKQWDKDIGGLALDHLWDMQQTNDGGYILAGYTYSGIGGDKTEPVWGSMDYWVVKLDSTGNKQWDKNYGSPGYEELSSIKQTSDGGYIIGGYSAYGIGGDKSQNTWGGYDYWMIKIDANGNKLWDKDFGGTSSDVLNSIIQTNDNGYLLSGISDSPISGDKTETNLGYGQMWIVKTDSIGNKLWDKTIFTLTSQGKGLAVESHDSCFVYATYTDAGIGGYKTQLSQGLLDFWVVKFCDSTLTTSINNKLNTNSNISISPNPVTKKLNFFLKKSANVKITNLLGEIIFNKTLIGKVEIDVSLFTNGIYLIQIGNEVKKFVKE